MPQLLAEARKRFGIHRFRPGQREILEAVLHGRSVLGIMPTGAGKSLTYQLPALFLPKPVVVVSPLIALMQDQQEHAAAADIAVQKFNSTLTQSESHEADAAIDEGTAQLIYVTPERLQSPGFVQQLLNAGGISLLVVDEAHCIPQWGHDFRPAYLCIGEARKALGMPPILALTATATPAVIHEVLESLHAADARIINTGTERTNLHFSVHPTVNTDAKLARIASMLEKEEGTGIIYTASVRSANELHDWLKDHGIAVARYHGKMTTRDRERAQEEFMRGDHKVIIATKAFGLGIDKPDIRFVFHFEFPDCLETYYQEAGRAGRDGLPSRAVLLYRLEDKRIQRFFLSGRYPKVDELRSVLQAVPPPAPHAKTLAASPPSSNTEPFSVLKGCGSSRALTALPPGVALATGATPTEASSSAHINPKAAQEAVPQEAVLSDTPEAAGVSSRRTQVILHLLRQARIIRRTRNGYVLAVADTPPDETLAEILQVYTDRAEHDKIRLAEMMHYAESVDCRVQIVRQYFADEPGEPCNRCDNCDRRTAEAAPQSSVGSAPAEPKPITRVETMHGTILTTAPQTLPHADEPACPFIQGALVRHRRFGQGKIKDTYGDVALVHFPKAGDKKLKTSYLTAA